MGFNDELSGQIVIDLETIAAPECAMWLDPVKPPANYKDPAKITAYCEEKRAEQIGKAALDADLCEIVAVGWQLPGESACVLTRQDADEGALIIQLAGMIAGRLMIGFNILNFDLPVLLRRAQLLEIPTPYLNLDRYRSPHVDLLERLTFNGKLTYRSLAFYCRRFGIPVTDSSSGADMAAMVATSDWLAVRSHCRSDVEKTAALAARLGWLKVAAAA